MVISTEVQRQRRRPVGWRLPDGFLREFKAFAALAGVDMKDLAQLAIAKLMDRPDLEPSAASQPAETQ